MFLTFSNTISSNLANAGATTGDPETVYKPLKPEFKTQYSENVKKNGISTVNVSFVDAKEVSKVPFSTTSLPEVTKSVVEDPQKQKKHSKSFAFYLGDEQIYEKNRAESLYNDLSKLNNDNKIEEIKIIDSNPRNNPQPPKNGN